jgi:chromosome partitioning protein
LGGALVKENFDVLLVDLDPQANLSLALGIQPHKIRRSTADVLLDSASPLSVSKETTIQGLDILPSNQKMILAERFLPARQNHQYVLKNAFTNLSIYDFIILDCPPSIGIITLNALIATKLLIIPTQSEYLSAYAIRHLLATIREVRKEANPNLIYRILITMLDIRIGSHNVITRQLQNTFGKALFDTIIQIDSKLRESTIAGVPITHYFPKCRGALQYQRLAQELSKNVEKREDKPSSG